jgi:hypothetical protein
MSYSPWRTGALLPETQKEQQQKQNFPRASERAASNSPEQREWVSKHRTQNCRNKTMHADTKTDR